MPRSRLAYAVSAVIANVVVLGIVVYAGLLHEHDYDRYYRSLQEDEALEWSTFWAFIGAAVVFAVAAARQRRAGLRVPWFLAGVSLFCFVVGMEEISWAQRLFAYRPPSYFLERNYQLELNVHNVISTDLRKIGLKSVIGVYGGLLPVLAALPGVKRWFANLGIVAPPLAFVPAFGLTYLLYEQYPWKYSGEIVELMLGVGFLLAGLWIVGRFARPADGAARVAGVYAGALVAVAGLGVANAEIAQALESRDPSYVETARAETLELGRDFEKIARRLGGRLASSCNVHKRVHSYMTKYRRRSLRRGSFAALTTRGLPEERAEFFLDPWNGPYWIRDRCADSRAGTSRRTFVYSFGPNMKRDSSATELRGDDVGAYIHGTRSD